MKNLKKIRLRFLNAVRKEKEPRAGRDIVCMINSGDCIKAVGEGKEKYIPDRIE